MDAYRYCREIPESEIYARGELLSLDRQDSPGESKGHDKNRMWIPKENGCGWLIVGEKRGDAKANRMERNLFHYSLSFFKHRYMNALLYI